MIEKVKLWREKNKQSSKKIKILKAKILELEKFGAGLLNRNTNRGKNVS